MGVNVTKNEVLEALKQCSWKRSGYVYDVLRQAHYDSILEGGNGFPPTTSLMRRRLKQLEKDGVIRCVDADPKGGYGVEWALMV